jgi:hypothetical protein
MLPWCRLTPEQGQAVQQSVDEAFSAARAMPMHLAMVMSKKHDWAMPEEEVRRRFGDKVSHPLAEQGSQPRTGDFGQLVDGPWPISTSWPPRGLCDGATHCGRTGPCLVPRLKTLACSTSIDRHFGTVVCQLESCAALTQTAAYVSKAYVGMHHLPTTISTVYSNGTLSTLTQPSLPAGWGPSST